MRSINEARAAEFVSHRTDVAENRMSRETHSKPLKKVQSESYFDRRSRAHRKRSELFFSRTKREESNVSSHMSMALRLRHNGGSVVSPVPTRALRERLTALQLQIFHAKAHCYRSEKDERLFAAMVGGHYGFRCTSVLMSRNLESGIWNLRFEI